MLSYNHTIVLEVFLYPQSHTQSWPIPIFFCRAAKNGGNMAVDLKQEDREYIEVTATETLDQFENVATSAKNELNARSVHGADVLANPNPMTGSAAIQNVNRISLENREEYTRLTKEPAIARVVVLDGNEQKKTYFICRACPPIGFLNMASYRTPLGRLASLPIGEDLTLPDGRYFVVQEIAKLHPVEVAEEWDSRESILETEDLGPITIESFRAFQSMALGKSLLEQIEAKEKEDAYIFEGVRRSVITKMGLRDQPILDKYQDEIFRLPLDKQMLILGPPGTGKTTTLIRRLGQKLDMEYLLEDERTIVEKIGSVNGTKHSDSWIMFTPTILLQQYLKEAFAREGIPASDLRVNTWDKFRRELARDKFNVLRNASGGGTFVLKEKAPSLRNEAISKPRDWFSDFDEWQRNMFVRELLVSSQTLGKNQDSEVAKLGQRLVQILERSDGKSLVSVFIELAAEVDAVRMLVSSRKQSTDTKIDEVLTIQLNRNRDFLTELGTFVSGLQQTQDVDMDEVEDQESDEEETGITRIGNIAASSFYRQAVRAQARAFASKRALTKDSRNAKIVEWIGQRTLSENDLAEVGASLLVQTAARRFLKPVKRYIDNMPRRYRSFRRQRQEEGVWYAKESFSPSDIHPLEVDIVLLSVLRSAKELLKRQYIVSKLEMPFWSSLNQVSDLYRNQVFVDEATDFSPIQLACMAELAQPDIRSFFACGDFNQRLTVWGSRTIEDVKWIFEDLEVKEITISYRQSRQLNEFARSIIRAVGGRDQIVTLTDQVDNEGVPPALLQSASDLPKTVTWLAERIREIEQYIKQLPSIAVFVNSEEYVKPVADALGAALEEHNIQVVACHDGQVMGHDNDVRVFDVQHIKGLEFEAVFFIAIDKLADLHPELFDKYLYVGATRAAMYLGITCDEALPKGMAILQPLFTKNWGNPLRV